MSGRLKNRLPPIVGHRGAAALAPENTIAGFEAARELGLSWIECDVSLLGDGVPVIFHDPRFERPTNGAGPLSKRTLEYARTLDAGAWFSAEFAGEPVPTLRTALDAFARLGLGANLEIKVHGGESRALAAAVAHHLRGADGVLVSSFDFDALRHFRAMDATAPAALLYRAVGTGWREAAAELGAEGIIARHDRLRAPLIEEIVETGMFVGAYTVNDPVLARRFLDCGVASVITDAPHRFDGRLRAESGAGADRASLGCLRARREDRT